MPWVSRALHAAIVGAWVTLGCGSGADGPSATVDELSPCVASPELCSSDTGVFTLSGYDPASAPDELAPLREALADAEIVGLGEAAHASAGFLGLKVRLTRELIERAGFRAIAWESARVPARRLDEYVQTCTGDPTEAVNALAEIWADVQTRDFARWLCEWNQRHPEDPVQVYGFDVQDPAADHAELEQFLSGAAPEAAPALIASLASCEQLRYEPCTAAIGALRARLGSMAAAPPAGVTREALATAQIALTSYAAWQDETMMPGYAPSFEARAVGMASVFLQLRALHFPGEKAVLWAHNIHVIKRHETVATSWVGAPIVTMGTAIDRAVGSDSYRAVGIIGFDVWLDRPEQRGRATPRASRGSLESVLHALGSPALFIDVQHPEASTVLPLAERLEIGAPGVEVHSVVDNYDGLLYLDHSPMAEVLWRTER